MDSSGAYEGEKNVGALGQDVEGATNGFVADALRTTLLCERRAESGVRRA